jgi:magnesium transporter
MGIRDIIEGLGDTANMPTSSHLNEVMKIRTTISAVVLPLTLLAGIYSMNVVLPLDENSPVAFLTILLLMALMYAKE